MKSKLKRQDWKNSNWSSSKNYPYKVVKDFVIKYKPFTISNLRDFADKSLSILNECNCLTGPECAWNDTEASPDTAGIPPNLGNGYVINKPWFTPTHSKPSLASNDVTQTLSTGIFSICPSMSVK